jgi:hypothetical protein
VIRPRGDWTRWTIARSLVALAFLAVGLTAFRHASPVVADWSVVITYCLLVSASCVAVSRGPGRWGAFAVAAWAYFLPIVVFQARITDILPTSWLIGEVAMRSRPVDLPAPPPDLPLINLPGRKGFTVDPRAFRRDSRAHSDYFRLLKDYNQSTVAAFVIGHCLVAMSFGAVAALLCRNRGAGAVPSESGRPRSDSAGRA